MNTSKRENLFPRRFLNRLDIGFKILQKIYCCVFSIRVYPAWKNNSDQTKLSERQASLSNLVCPIKDPPKTSQTSQHYRIERFKRPRIGSPLCRKKLMCIFAAWVSHRALETQMHMQISSNNILNIFPKA